MNRYDRFKQNDNSNINIKKNNDFLNLENNLMIDNPLSNRQSLKINKENFTMLRSTSHLNFLKKNDKLNITPRKSRDVSSEHSPNKLKSNLTNNIKVASFNFPYQINDFKNNLPNILKRKLPVHYKIPIRKKSPNFNSIEFQMSQGEFNKLNEIRNPSSLHESKVIDDIKKRNSKSILNLLCDIKENPDSRNNKLFKNNNLAFKSKAGKNNLGRIKTNQDNLLVFTRVLNNDNYNIFGVFDGHGVYGHLVSNFAKTFFKEYYNRKEIYSKNDIFNSLVNDDYKIIKDSFYEIEKSLIKANIEADFSGSTCVILFMVSNKLICANAGDSRAIIINERINKYNRNEIVQLSRDHKPELADEKLRIINSDGRVDRAIQNGVRCGPFRVFLKNHMYPGLAMSRSIGDFVAESVGVICEPEITEYIICDKSKYIVLASDGIWEFLSNERVSDIVNIYYNVNNVETAVNTLIEEAIRCWIIEDDTIDDISVIVVFLNK